jgi:hypothetical protein
MHNDMMHFASRSPNEKSPAGKRNSPEPISGSGLLTSQALPELPGIFAAAQLHYVRCRLFGIVAKKPLAPAQRQGHEFC